jgi:hypothetical protein
LSTQEGLEPPGKLQEMHVCSPVQSSQVMQGGSAQALEPPPPLPPSPLVSLSQATAKTIAAACIHNARRELVIAEILAARSGYRAAS